MSCKTISRLLIEVGLNDGPLCDVSADGRKSYDRLSVCSRQSLVADTAVKVNKLQK